MILTPDRLDSLLLPPKSEEVNLPTLLQALFDRSYTGQLVLHFHNGKPHVIAFPAPQLRLSS